VTVAGVRLLRQAPGNEPPRRWLSAQGGDTSRSDRTPRGDAIPRRTPFVPRRFGEGSGAGRTARRRRKTCRRAGTRSRGCDAWSACVPFHPSFTAQ
jgi:hypothetical protein